MAARAGTSLAASVSAAAGVSVDPEELRASVSERLADGAFRLVVAVDQITDELRRSVEYLNQHLSDSVLLMALELGYLKQDGVEILVPKTYGAEFETLRRREMSSKRRWTAEDVVVEADNVENAVEKGFVQTLLRHADDHGAVVKGGVGAAPSAGYYYLAAGRRRSLWSLYMKPEGPVVAINLGSVANGAPAAAQSMLDALDQCGALRARLGDSSTSPLGKYPEFSVAAIAHDAEALPAVLAALDAAIASFPSLDIEPFTTGDASSDWANRTDDFVTVIDWVTRRLLGSRPPSPMQSGTGFPKYRYGPSVLDGATFAIGLRKSSSKSTRIPLWLRYHHDTPGFDGIRNRLVESSFADELDQEGGHAWLPLAVPFDTDGEHVGAALVTRVREIEQAAQPAGGGTSTS